ncbi:hypothetical protein ACFE04_023695 [Oxalis oulophora]
MPSGNAANCICGQSQGYAATLQRRPIEAQPLPAGCHRQLPLAYQAVLRCREKIQPTVSLQLQIYAASIRDQQRVCPITASQMWNYEDTTRMQLALKSLSGLKNASFGSRTLLFCLIKSFFS